MFFSIFGINSFIILNYSSSCNENQNLNIEVTIYYTECLIEDGAYNTIPRRYNKPTPTYYFSLTIHILVLFCMGCVRQMLKCRDFEETQQKKCRFTRYQRLSLFVSLTKRPTDVLRNQTMSLLKYQVHRIEISELEIRKPVTTHGRK